jgi:hypothetical protein
LLAVYNLTTSQYERVRNLVRRSPAFIGMRVVVHDDTVEVLEPDDLVLGLGPVYEAVVGVAEDQWPNLVDERLEWMINALSSDNRAELDRPTDQLLDRIYAKLRPDDESAMDAWNYANKIAPDLLLTIALDYPDRIAILNDEQVRQHGFERLMDAGLENLHGQLPDRYGTDEMGVYWVIGTEYMASMVTLLPWVVANIVGTDDFPHGLLTAVPDDHTLLFHVLHDGAGARYAMGELARLAAETYADSPRPISRNVYWWSYGAGDLKPVADHAGHDNSVIGGNPVRTHHQPDFADLMAELDQVRG